MTKDRNNKEDEVWVTLRQGGETYNRYEVSNYGRVWNIEKDFEVGQQLRGKPQYYYVNIQQDGKERRGRRVHNIMGWSFLGEPPTPKHTVDHIDQNKFNNHLDNLRWLDKRGQMINRGNTIFYKGKPLTVFLTELGYDLSNGVGRYLYHRMAVFKESYVDAAFSWGENIKPSPKELSEKSFKHSIEYNNHWYPSLKMLSKEVGVSKETLDNRLREGMSLEEAIHYNPLDKHRFTFEGFFMNKEEHCKRLGISYSRIVTKMRKHNLTFEEALQLPLERTTKHCINGIIKRNFEWYEHFGLDNSKRCVNNYNCKHKNFRKTLEHFGVDTSEMEIYPCDGNTVCKSRPL